MKARCATPKGVCCVLLLSLLLLLQAAAAAQPPPTSAPLFERLTGTHTNRDDVALGVATIEMLHFTCNISDRISNLPAPTPQQTIVTVTLVEGYDTNLTSGETLLAPEVYMITQEALDNTSSPVFVMYKFNLPDGIPVDALRINNTALRIDYSQLHRDTAIAPAVWVYDHVTDIWACESITTTLPDGSIGSFKGEAQPYRLTFTTTIKADASPLAKTLSQQTVRLRRIPQTYEDIDLAARRGFAIGHAVSYVYCPPYEAKHAFGGGRDHFLNFIFAYSLDDTTATVSHVDGQQQPIGLSFGSDLIIENYQGPGYVYDVGQETLFVANTTFNIFAADIDSQSLFPYYTETIQCNIRDMLAETGSATFFVGNGIPLLLVAFASIVTSAVQGLAVRIVYNWPRCSNVSFDVPSAAFEQDMRRSMVAGVTSFETWEYFLNLPPMPFIASARTRIRPMFGGTMFFREILRVTVYADQTLHANVTLLQPANFSYVASMRAVCSIPTGDVSVFGMTHP